MEWGALAVVVRAELAAAGGVYISLPLLTSEVSGVVEETQ